MLSSLRLWTELARNRSQNLQGGRMTFKLPGRQRRRSMRYDVWPFTLRQFSLIGSYAYSNVHGFQSAPSMACAMRRIFLPFFTKT